jgi:hypothetical protein
VGAFVGSVLIAAAPYIHSQGDGILPVNSTQRLGHEARSSSFSMWFTRIGKRLQTKFFPGTFSSAEERHLNKNKRRKTEMIAITEMLLPGRVAMHACQTIEIKSDDPKFASSCRNRFLGSRLGNRLRKTPGTYAPPPESYN